MKIENSNFKNNSAKIAGGALRTSNIKLLVNSSTFLENKFINIDGNCFGGAVYASNSP